MIKIFIDVRKDGRCHACKEMPGICSYCQGDRGKKEVCQACEGSGECYLCRGTGKVLEDISHLGL